MNNLQPFLLHHSQSQLLHFERKEECREPAPSRTSEPFMISVSRTCTFIPNPDPHHIVYNLRSFLGGTLSSAQRPPREERRGPKSGRETRDCIGSRMTRCDRGEGQLFFIGGIRVRAAHVHGVAKFTLGHSLFLSFSGTTFYSIPSKL